eukprot:scaffold1148_cov209-Alexandrium_tamarense.AAC.2
MDIDSSSPHHMALFVESLVSTALSATGQQRKQATLFIHQIEKQLGGTLQIMDTTSVTPPTHVL